MTKQTKTVSIKGYLTHETGVYADSKQPFSFQTYKPSKSFSPDMVLVSEAVIKIQVPANFDPRPQLIEALKAEQQKAAADFQKLSTEIMRKISELQALEAS